MNKHLRGLRMQPATINEEARTAEVVFTSGATVKRYDYEGIFNEVLVVDQDSVNLERLNSGAPLLDSHRSWDTENVIGVVESAEIRDGLGYAVVRFSTDEAADAVFRKVKEGVLRNLSVGYGIDESEMVLNDAGERELQVKRWTPHEISVVAVPADAKSQFRSLSDDVPEIALERAKQETDDEEQETETPEDDHQTSEPEGESESEVEAEALGGEAEDEEPATEADSEETSSDEEDDEEEASADERMAPADIVRRCLDAGVAERAPEFIESQPTKAEFETRLTEVSEIRSLCTRFQKDTKDFAGKNIDQVRKLILDSMVTEDAEIQSRHSPETEPPQKRENPLSPAKIYAAYRSNSIL